MSILLSSSRKCNGRELTSNIPEKNVQTSAGLTVNALAHDSHKSITARSTILDRDHNVFNVNLVENLIKFVLQLLCRSFELQISHIKSCSRSLPPSVDVNCIRHFVKSICECLVCFILNFLRCFGDLEFTLNILHRSCGLF